MIFFFFVIYFLFVLIKITFVYTHSFIVRAFLLVGISMSVFYSYCLLLMKVCWCCIKKCILHVKMGGVNYLVRKSLSNFLNFRSIFSNFFFPRVWCYKSTVYFFRKICVTKTCFLNYKRKLFEFMTANKLIRQQTFHSLFFYLVNKIMFSIF